MPNHTARSSADGFRSAARSLLRAVRMAFDPRKLTLAGLALTVLWLGEVGLSYLPFAPGLPFAAGDAALDTAAPVAPWRAVRPLLLTGWGGPAATVWDAPGAASRAALARMADPLEPLIGVTRLPFGGAAFSWAAVAWAWTRLLWALAVWSVFGGAISRIAAVEFARDERPSLAAAVRFSLARLPSFFSAPLLPLSGVLFLWTLCALGGLVGRIPAVGPWLVAVMWGVAAVFALLLLAIAIGTAVGWPLMVAGIATEGSDAFDGFSRSFSGLFGRPWAFLGLAAGAVLIGLFAIAVADTLAVGLACAAARTVATGMGADAVAGLHTAAPDYFRTSGLYPFGAAAGPAEEATAAAGVVGFWLCIIATAAAGYAASYFWSAATVVYFLLRRIDDGTHLDEVYLGEPAEEDDLLPLAGIAATGQPVTERSHQPTVSPPAEGVTVAGGQDAAG